MDKAQEYPISEFIPMDDNHTIYGCPYCMMWSHYPEVVMRHIETYHTAVEHWQTEHEEVWWKGSVKDGLNW